jgi:putative PIN family toxin of toxin-antitoxin system
MRVVIDTNALIAALTKPRGSAAKVVRAWRERRVELVSSEETLREARLVLGAPWLARLASRSEIERLLRELRARSVVVRPQPIHDLLLKDEGDLRLVEAAVAGRAAYLVTADRELLSQRGYGPTEFVTSVEMARLLSP